MVFVSNVTIDFDKLFSAHNLYHLHGRHNQQMNNTQPIIWMIDGLGPGGAEQLMPAILKNLKKAGLNIRICALQNKHGNPIAVELERLGLPVDLLLIPNLRHPLNLFRILRYLQIYRPQILHTQLEFSDILGTVAAKILGIPTISTLHTLDAWEEYGSAGWRLKLRWFILRHLTDRVIAVSEKTRLHHIENAKIKSRKIITIYNGIELSRFKQITLEHINQLKQSLGLSTGAIITTVAVLREPKGIQFMLQALPAIRKGTPNTKYLIVGDGAYKKKLIELVEQLDLQTSVIFAGQRTDIPDLLACSDLFVLPTLTDALPTVLLEALAAEKPIIASNVGGIPEIIENGTNGFLVSPGEPTQLSEACNKLLSNRVLCEVLVTAGSKIAQQRFDIKVQIGQLIKTYEELLEKNEKQK